MATDTSKYKLNHTMLRVKDPKRSIKFYEFLGLKVINSMKNPDAKFDLYFLAYDSPNAVSPGKHWTDREGIIELTHNYGTEEDPEYSVVNGNTEPYKGFSHVCISVDNIQAACKRIEDAGYAFQKKLTDGSMRHLAFALDPDQYWVEIIGQKPVEETESITTTEVDTYRMNHSMIRVKDVKKSLHFYQDILGLKLLRTVENEAAKFNLYFLGYGSEKSEKTSPHEGIVELMWNYGTESDTDFFYHLGNADHKGNTEKQGFGHLCITVDDLQAACDRFEEKKVNFKKRLTDGRMKNLAFITDPDGYSIEVLQNEGLKKLADW